MSQLLLADFFYFLPFFINYIGHVWLQLMPQGKVPTVTQLQKQYL